MVVRHKPLPVGDGSNATNASFLWQDRVSQVTGMDSNISEKEALNPLEVSFGTPMNDGMCLNSLDGAHNTEVNCNSATKRSRQPSLSAESRSSREHRG